MSTQNNTDRTRSQSDATRSEETSASVVCAQCKTGLLVFVQTGAVRAPYARVYRCNHCGTTDIRQPEGISADGKYFECGEGYAHPIGTVCTGQCVFRG